LQPKVAVRPVGCDRTWCAVSVMGGGYRGYVRQADLWGIYPDEVIKEHAVWNSFKRLL